MHPNQYGYNQLPPQPHMGQPPYGGQVPYQAYPPQPVVPQQQQMNRQVG